MRFLLSLFYTLFIKNHSGAQQSEKQKRYIKAQKQRRKDFHTFGGKPCKICSTRIPGNKTYCYDCWYKYRKGK
jgi:hypothetical protein